MPKIGAVPGTLGTYATSGTPAIVMSNPSSDTATVRVLGDSPDDDQFAGPPPPGIQTLNASEVAIDTVAGANRFLPGVVVPRWFDRIEDLFTAFNAIKTSPDDKLVGQLWIARNAQESGFAMYLLDRPGGTGDHTLGQLVEATNVSVVTHSNAVGESVSVPAAGVVLGAPGVFAGLEQDFVFPDDATFGLQYADGVHSNFREGQWEFYTTFTADLPVEQLKWELALQQKPDGGSWADVAIVMERETDELEDAVRWTNTGLVSLAAATDDEYRYLLRHDETGNQTATLFRNEQWVKSYGLLLGG